MTRVAHSIATVLPCVIALAMATDASRGASPVSSSSVVGITLSLRSPIGFSGVLAEVVYFVRLNEGESPEAALARGQLLATHHAQADRLLLLGASPGTYVAVAASYRTSYSGQYLHAGTVRTGQSSAASAALDPFASEDVHRTYFAREVVESTRVVVGPDAFAYAGELELQQTQWIDEGDVIQLLVQQLLEPDSTGQPEGLRAPSQWISYEGALLQFRRDPEGELRFLEHARKKLKKTKWAAPLERRRAALRATSSRER